MTENQDTSIESPIDLTDIELNLTDDEQREEELKASIRSEVSASFEKEIAVLKEKLEVLNKNTSEMTADSQLESVILQKQQMIRTREETGEFDDNAYEQLIHKEVELRRRKDVLKTENSPSKEQSPSIHPAYEKFFEDNPWYRQNKPEHRHVKEFALQLDDKIRAENPNLDNFNIVKILNRSLRKKFPDFEGFVKNGKSGDSGRRELRSNISKPMKDTKMTNENDLGEGPQIYIATIRRKYGPVEAEKRVAEYLKRRSEHAAKPKRTKKGQA